MGGDSELRLGVGKGEFIYAEEPTFTHNVQTWNTIKIERGVCRYLTASLKCVNMLFLFFTPGGTSY